MSQKLKFLGLSTRNGHHTYISYAEKHFRCASLCGFPHSRCNCQGQPPRQHQILRRAAPPFLLDAPSKS